MSNVEYEISNFHSDYVYSNQLLEIQTKTMKLIFLFFRLHK